MHDVGKQSRFGAAAYLPGAVLAVAIWVFAGPAQFGGFNTYLMTSGNSMEPRFRAGDLAVVRKAPSYGPGSVIAYRLSDRAIVLHRIIGQDGGRFVMKGDNNNFVDATEPEPSQVLGELWIHVPGAGRLLEKLRSPWLVTGLVLAAGLVSVVGRGRRAGKGRRRPQSAPNERHSVRGREPPLPREEILAVAVVFAAISLVLAVVWSARPAQRTVGAPVSYEQKGVFSYSSPAGGSVYAGNEVRSGDPVFLKLVRDLNVSFDYRFQSRAPHSLTGTYRLDAEVAQDTGWRRTIELVPDTPFSGDSFSVSGIVPLGEVQTMTSALEQQTGLQGANLTVAVVPHVTVQGSMAGGALSDSYSPRLDFHLDAFRLELEHATDKVDPLRPSQTGAVIRPQMEPDRLSLLGIDVPVGTARNVALLIYLLSSAVAVLVVRPVLAARDADEAGRIEARYGSLLLNVQADSGNPAVHDQGRVVDLLHIEDLVRAAEQNGRMILHSTGDGVHRYFVSDGELVYRYVTPRRSSTMASVDEQEVRNA